MNGRRAGLDRSRKRNREYVDTFKNGKPCADCGGVFPPFVMDFDHVRGEKVECVTRLSRSGAALHRIEAEIAKCELVCSNCHRVRTFTRKPRLERRAYKRPLNIPGYEHVVSDISFDYYVPNVNGVEA